MSRPLRRRGLLAALPWAVPALACTRVKVAELPLRLVEGYAVVPASLAGQAVSLLLDTGAQGMLVTPEPAATLALPLAGTPRIFGPGGSQEARVVALPDLRLAGVPMPEQLAPVAPLPALPAVTPPLAGLLGAGLLRQFDLELDVPGGRLTLWSGAGCPLPAGIALQMEITRAGEAFVPVRVNGRTLLAQLDSGSRATILSTAAARRLGLDAPVSANTAPGIDGNRLPVGHTRARLGLGDERAEDWPVSIAPLQLERGDMLLGLDRLGRRRVWLFYGARIAVFAR